MENRTEEKIESRKDWVAPELKKIDIEEVTAGGSGEDTDGNGGDS